MSNLSPNNKIINSTSRNRYIDKLRGNIGLIKDNNRTPIGYKILDTYEEVVSKVSKKNILIFIFLFIFIYFILFYFKPSFILKNKKDDTQMKLSSNKNSNEKIVNHIKLLIYSIIITVIIYSILFFGRKKIPHVEKLFEKID